MGAQFHFKSAHSSSCRCVLPSSLPSFCSLFTATDLSESISRQKKKKMEKKRRLRNGEFTAGPGRFPVYHDSRSGNRFSTFKNGFYSRFFSKTRRKRIHSRFPGIGIDPALVQRGRKEGVPLPLSPSPRKGWRERRRRRRKWRWDQSWSSSSSSSSAVGRVSIQGLTRRGSRGCAVSCASNCARSDWVFCSSTL